MSLGIPHNIGICANWLPRHTQFSELLHPAWLQKACRQSVLPSLCQNKIRQAIASEDLQADGGHLLAKTSYASCC